MAACKTCSHPARERIDTELARTGVIDNERLAAAHLYQSITVQGRLDRRSVDQLAAESMRRQNLSRRRTG